MGPVFNFMALMEGDIIGSVTLFIIYLLFFLILSFLSFLPLLVKIGAFLIFSFIIFQKMGVIFASNL